MNAVLQQTDVDPAVTQARQVLYRFASLTLLDPRVGTWPQLHALRDDDLLADAAEVIRQDPAATAEELGRGERSLSDLSPAAVLAALPASSVELNRQYEATFGLLVSGACPPYETEYINGKFAIQRSHALADISGFYGAFGLQTSTAHPERHDHLALELEFMAFLSSKELQAAQNNDDSSQDHVIVCREAQERFFREHLVWWTPAFARLLTFEAGEGYYRQVAQMLAALVTSERARFGLPVPQGARGPANSKSPKSARAAVWRRSKLNCGSDFIAPLRLEHRSAAMP